MLRVTFMEAGVVARDFSRMLLGSHGHVGRVRQSITDLAMEFQSQGAADDRIDESC